MANRAGIAAGAVIGAVTLFTIPGLLFVFAEITFAIRDGLGLKTGPRSVVDAMALFGGIFAPFTSPIALIIAILSFLVPGVPIRARVGIAAMVASRLLWPFTFYLRLPVPSIDTPYYPETRYELCPMRESQQPLSDSAHDRSVPSVTPVARSLTDGGNGILHGLTAQRRVCRVFG